ncbi:type II toxin-antitoxin system VapC family toxin [Nocardioides sp. YIM 152588]|uniref:type II toxin-antitoxin system VapC family toxin n=1 Tax=Nocardioides sp. YIM 152588 TaxID=3158259 RepID=UPI0032E4C2D8
MIVYFDTSAVVPILIAEPTSALCRRAWQDADRRVTSRLTYVETGAALAMAERQGRLTSDGYDQAWGAFVAIWPDLDVVDLSDGLAQRAAALARSSALRGYDAVHCAAAEAVADDDVVAATGDAGLIAAWHGLGVSVLDVNRSA